MLNESKTLPGSPISLPSQAEKQCHCKTKGASIHPPKLLTVSLAADGTACHSAMMASPSLRVLPISFKITVLALEGMSGKEQGAHHIRRHCPPSTCADAPQGSWCRTSAEAFTVRRAASLYIKKKKKKENAFQTFQNLLLSSIEGKLKNHYRNLVKRNH
ncbi:unnamed protein product [Rangifer tarandus platyrhynchus]|uniref:Uncharacterized protein n=1 Tax=Rangifer tarandus platyrhynchus TaxID=3082113 RepID=A0AC59ZUK1_RANTA